MMEKADLDIMYWDWAFHCCPALVDCLDYEEDRKIVIEIAYKMVNPGFFSTDPAMTIHSKFAEELGVIVEPAVCKKMKDGWLRISRLQQELVDWVD